MTGQRISNYDVLEKLGEGGMGVVYKARDARLNRPVAIKFLTPGELDDAERRQRFMREARAASALNHPNIVTVYDIGADNGRDFIVMEFIEGKTLEALIHGGLRMKESLRIAAQVAGGVGRAHRAGILHRDLKPSNIMVTPEGLAKILDFGLAKLTEMEAPAEGDATKTRQTLTQEGTIAGTVAYMSPEQAEGKKLDSRSDVFSFGSVLYEMLNGARAFRGTSRVSTMAAILEREPERSGKVPPELDRLVRRCLRKEPDRRWQSMDDLKLALEELSEDSVSGTSISPSPGAHRANGKWLVAGGIVAAAAMGATAAAYFRSPSLPNAGPVLTRLTEDAGVSVNPSISPDGKLVAYASDRAGEGNLDIWVKQAAGGEPVRVTRDQADETDPSFSPGSNQIAFRSQRDGGGVYFVSALGGEAKLFAPKGRGPKFSPDGKWLAYYEGEVGGIQNRSSVFLVPASGGAPQKVEASGLVGIEGLVWSPDSSRILVSALDPATNSADWWLLNPAGAAPVALKVRPLISPAGGDRSFGTPRAWLDQFVYFDKGSDVWRIHLNGTALAGPPERITAGASLLTQVMAGPGASGKPLLALSSQENDLNIWFIPMDTLRGNGVAEPRRLTDSLAAERAPFVSRNGRKMAFLRGRHAWVKDLASGKEIEGPMATYVPGLDFEGGKLTYPADGKMWVVTPPLQAPAALLDRRARTLDFYPGRILRDIQGDPTGHRSDRQKGLLARYGKPGHFGVDRASILGS